MGAAAELCGDRVCSHNQLWIPLKRQSNYSLAPSYGKHKCLWGHTFSQARELIQLKTNLPKKIVSPHLGDPMAACQWKWEESSSKKEKLHCLNIIIPIHPWIFHFHFSEHSPHFNIDCVAFSYPSSYESAFVCTKWIGKFVCPVWCHRVKQTTLHGCPDQVMTCHPNNFYITLKYPWWFYIYLYV